MPIQQSAVQCFTFSQSWLLAGWLPGYLMSVTLEVQWSQLVVTLTHWRETKHWDWEGRQQLQSMFWLNSGEQPVAPSLATYSLVWPLNKISQILKVSGSDCFCRLWCSTHFFLVISLIICGQPWPGHNTFQSNLARWWLVNQGAWNMEWNNFDLFLIKNVNQHS